ncbi:MAG: response regulator [Candidatus Omnitrophica bacterium]|nr:response regulator [Candidatus Omnitrophota bacterium]MBU1925594.1 response regulator [Candidatus Omnitrophota bacterium]
MSGQKNILIIEDNLKESQELAAFFMKNGFSVMAAADGEAAFKMIEEKLPDLIILDVILPKVDGFTIAKKIKYEEKTKQTPIIVLTAKDGMRELFAIEGIPEYLVKPVAKEALLELVKKYLKT